MEAAEKVTQTTSERLCWNLEERNVESHSILLLQRVQTDIKQKSRFKFRSLMSKPEADLLKKSSLGLHHDMRDERNQTDQETHPVLGEIIKWSENTSSASECV